MKQELKVQTLDKKGKCIWRPRLHLQASLHPKNIPTYKYTHTCRLHVRTYIRLAIAQVVSSHSVIST